VWAGRMLSHRANRLQRKMVREHPLRHNLDVSPLE